MEQQTTLRIGAKTLALLDKWCVEHPLKPSRAQAIRSFIEAGVEAGVPKKGEPPPVPTSYAGRNR